MDMNEENTTNQELVGLIKSLIVKVDEQARINDEREQVNIEFQQESRNATREIRAGIAEIQKCQFTEDEKNDLLGIKRHIDKRLENEALGEKDITLNRDEYDAASLSRGFTNRFKMA